MKPIATLGIVLIVLGIAGLFFSRVSFLKSLFAESGSSQKSGAEDLSSYSFI